MQSTSFTIYRHGARHRHGASHRHCARHRNCARGFSMVEILVTISIMALLVAILVPQIRMVTKERGIREATRTVGSAFSEASLRARTDGVAGIAIVRNPNYFRYANNTTNTYDSVGGRVYYSANTIYQLRAVRPYVGNELGEEGAFRLAAGLQTFTIASPFSDSLLQELLKDALYLKFPGRAGKFGIIPFMTIHDPVLRRLTFVLQPNPDLPNFSNGFQLPFELHRAPRVDTTSEVRLPRGYHINLNYSGNLDLADADANPFTWTTFSQYLPPRTPTPTPTDPNLMPIIITFDESGGLDLILPNASHGVAYVTHEPLAICVVEDRDADNFRLDITGASAPLDFMPKGYIADGTDLLNNPLMQWVVINNRSANATVADSATPTTPLTVANAATEQPLRMLQSRLLSATRQNTTQ